MGEAGTRIDNVRCPRKRMLPVSAITQAALFYISFPVLLFLLGFVKPLIGIPVCLGVIAALVSAIRRIDDGLGDASDAVEFSFSTIGIVFAVSLIWCIICGQGGIVVQKWDWNFRNACFRDLITHSWPVVYNDFNNALVYYVGHWLPSAAFARFVYVIKGDIGFAWFLGNMILMIWTALGVAISLLMYLGLFRTSKFLSYVIFIVLFFGFGGLDAAVEAKMLYANVTGRIPFSIIENWAKYVSMENKTSQLAWVFHQAVPAWMATLIVVHDRKMINWVFVLAMLTLSAPLPSCGLFIMMIVVAVVEFASQANFCRSYIVKTLLSPRSLAGMLATIIIGAYLTSNPAAGRFHIWKMGGTSGIDAMSMLSFVVVEWVVYVCVSWCAFRSSRWFCPTVVALIVASFVHVGPRADFSMRASIPALLVLQVFVAKLIVEPLPRKQLTRGAKILVASLLIVGSGGAAVDVANTVQRTFWSKGTVEDSDQIVSFDRDLIPEHIQPPSSWWDWRCHLNNFFVNNPQDIFFFRWMAAGWSSRDEKNSGSEGDNETR